MRALYANWFTQNLIFDTQSVTSCRNPLNKKKMKFNKFHLKTGLNMRKYDTCQPECQMQWMESGLESAECRVQSGEL